MLLRLLKNQHLSILLLLPFLFMALYLPIFYHGVCNPAVEISNFVFFTFFYKSPLLYFYFGTFILLVLMIAVNAFAYKHLLFSQRTYLPAFFYFMLNAVNPNRCFFIESQLLALFMFVVLNHSFNSFREKFEKPTVFIDAFILTLFIIVLPISIYFTFFLFISISIIRSSGWRMPVMIILGILAVVIFYSTGLFLFNDSITSFWQIITSKLWAETSIATLNTFQIYYLSAVFLMIFISIVFIMRRMITQKIQIQRYQLVLIMLFLFCITLIIIMPSVSFNILPILSIPASLLLTNYFIANKFTKLNNLLLLIWIIAIITNNFWSQILYLVSLIPDLSFLLVYVEKIKNLIHF